MGTVIPERGTLQLANLIIVTSEETGIGSAQITIPAEGRILSGGFGKFDNPLPGDKALALEFLDPSGQNVIESFCDTRVPEENQGWWLRSDALQIHALTNMRLVPGGVILRIRVKKETPIRDTFRCNLLWGKP